MVSGSIGERVAAYRRRRGLSQAALAGLIGRSESWLSQAAPVEPTGDEAAGRVPSRSLLCDALVP
ncbi:helix-turn-helix domain-containing protein [Micromonospora chersina]|uniref:helix-turn-helix domain-containing protein n=1 Tax=Micromonospora chersina TaxID=47854 RepID=UPI00371CAEDF